MYSNIRRQQHAYIASDMQWLSEKVALPPKLKCDTCDKNFGLNNFSNKQLSDARLQVHKTGRITKSPRCLKCTGSRLVELECIMCRDTKGLEEFAKNQRKDKHNARCFECTTTLVGRQPFEDNGKTFFKSSTSIGFAPDVFSPANSTRDTASVNGDWEDIDSTNGSHRKNNDGGIDLSDRFQQGMSINGGVTDALVDSEFFSQPPSGIRSNNQSEMAGTRSFHTSTAASSSAGHGHYGPSSSTSVAGSLHSFNSDITEPSMSGRSGVETKNGFARIRASDLGEDPWAETGSHISASDDESESDSDDEDDDDHPEGFMG